VKKIAKIDQYLAKIWTECNSLLFWPTLYTNGH